MSQSDFPLFLSAGPNPFFSSSNDNTSASSQQQWNRSQHAKQPPKKRRNEINSTVNELYRATWIRTAATDDQARPRLSGRNNKNEILGLTNARLVKERSLQGQAYTNGIDLVRDIQFRKNNLPSSDHGTFILVLRTDGRVVAFSDEVEQHLGKSLRALYTQCIDIFTCLDATDSAKLRAVLNTASPLSSSGTEYRLVCTLRLPKGKRPSRTHEDVKTISMVGHFYVPNSVESEQVQPLFIARCESLLSTSTNGSAITSSNYLKLTLGDDLTIQQTSSNITELLGYARHEVVGASLARFLPPGHLEAFETVREAVCQNSRGGAVTHQQEQERAAANSVCVVLDLYSNGGDTSLSFLCQVRPMRERRSSAVKMTLVAQLIDPSLRHECAEYVRNCSVATSSSSPPQAATGKSSEIMKAANKTIAPLEQVNWGAPPSWHDASFAMGLFEYGICCPGSNESSRSAHHNLSHSPLTRSLSNKVSPVSLLNNSGTVKASWSQEEYEGPFIAEFDGYAMEFMSPGEIEKTFLECAISDNKKERIDIGVSHEDELRSIDLMMEDDFFYWYV